MRSLPIVAALLAGCHAASPPPKPATAAPAPAPTRGAGASLSEPERAPADSGAPHESAIDAILRAASPRISSPDEARRLLADARAHARPAERGLLDHAEALAKAALEIDAAVRGPGSLEDKKARIEPMMAGLLAGYADLLREARPIYADDASHQVTLAATLYTLADIEGAGAARERWKKEAYAWAKELGAKFPASAKVARLLGSLCTGEDEEVMACVRHYARCAELDGAMPECKEEAARLARLFTAPRCEGAVLRKDLGVFFGTPKKSPRAREVEVAHVKIYLEPKPSFVAADFAFAETVYVGAMSERGETSEGEEVFVAVKPERQGAFSAWLTRPEQAKDGFVVVMLGAKVIASAPAGSLRDGKGMLLPLHADAVCDRTERRALPPDLRLP